MRHRPSARIGAYLLLWLFLGGIILWRRAPEVGLQVEPGHRQLAPVRIDLNHDPWVRLTLIEGIGEILANRIVTARTTQGPFRSLEEVMAIDGVPDAPLEAARPWLSLGEKSPENRTP